MNPIWQYPRSTTSGEEGGVDWIGSMKDDDSGGVGPRHGERDQQIHLKHGR